MASADLTVSVVVPAYNHAKYLREAIESVLAQDYPRVELIVLDDGSTDDTREVLRSFSPACFYWETQQNMGQAGTLNKGWRMAAGDVLAYLSADDVLCPGAISAAVEILRSNADVACTYCDFHLISTDSKVVRTMQTGEFDYLRMVLQMITVPGPGAFFRRAAFEAAGGWNPAYRQMPDLEFWLRLGLHGKMQRIPKALGLYRVHEGAQTFQRTSRERADEPCRIAREFLALPGLPAEVRARKHEMLSHSCLISAQLHGNAGRWQVAIERAGQAIWHSPGCVLSPAVTRFGHAVCPALLPPPAEHVALGEIGAWVGASAADGSDAEQQCAASTQRRA